MGYNQNLRRLKAMQANPTMKEAGGVSLIHPYYNDANRLLLHLDVWKNWSESVCRSVNITLVDDGSPKPLNISDTDKEFLTQKGIRISIYRILKDLRYNTPGALNLGVLMATNPWVLFMDSDCFFDSENWEKILAYKVAPKYIVKFARKRFGDPVKEDLKMNRYLPCAMLMHKQTFNKIGGFDEDFTGQYSGGYGFFDNEFDGRAIKVGAWSERASHGNQSVADDIIAGEWMPSVYKGSITQRDNKHEAKNKALMHKKYAGEVPRNKQLLNFPWEQVYTNWFQVKHET